MVDINISCIVQMINFILLIFILNALLFKPIRGMLKTRQEKFNQLGNDIDGFATESQNKANAFTDGMKDARLKGLKEKEALVKEATDEEKKMVAEINAKAVAELDKVRATIKKDAEEVKAGLMKQVDAFAQEIGQKILGRTV